MIIRQLVEDDAEAFRTLRLHALQESPEAFGSSYEETVTQSVADMAQRLRASQDTLHNFYLGAFDHSPIGMVAFQRGSRIKEQHKGAIRSLYVTETARGRGIGRALLKQAIVLARQQSGLEQISLAVVSTNQAACNLYASCGFEVYGVEPRALRLGTRYFDEDLMILRL